MVERPEGTNLYLFRKDPAKSYYEFYEPHTKKFIAFVLGGVEGPIPEEKWWKTVQRESLQSLLESTDDPDCREFLLRLV